MQNLVKIKQIIQNKHSTVLYLVPYYNYQYTLDNNFYFKTFINN